MPLRARAAGSVTLLSSAEVESGDGWPRLLRCQGRWCQEVSCDAHDVHDVYDVHVPCCLPSDAESDTTGDTWPLLLLLQPGEASDTTGTTGTTGTAVDGTVMVFCARRHGGLVVMKQIIAWRGQAFQLQEMFGIQELHSAADDSSTRACVICLTAPKNTAVLPCRHFCCCYDCARSLRFSGAGRKRCPLCRSQVTDILRLDMEPAEANEALPESRQLADGAQALPSSASRRLALELRATLQRAAALRAEHQLELSLAEEGDLRLWRMLLYTEGFGSSTLGHELRRWEVEAVELELWICQSFPHAPPAVRVMRPRFAPGSFWVHEHGALCMEVLTQSGWSPALSLAQLGLQIKDLLVSGTGHLTNAGSMADPGLAARQARQRAMQVAQRLEQVHADW